ncbi:glycosyltransferase family 25 protein [Pseudosulfitobacter pseudonitzschiae]|uniref:glycosyltransferase family 25 protein n=1 Tax=Pseudosulfitobacter pseudonitzschiae TaxID=1402135 RepID=UPI001AF43D17|nr:glycosyltransferase family 25 protein [Pseudosulfitobacter pseudonitzschiae]MBM1815869.1 glycosyltransferase family 25 protein [Pseudosulfitobacter pseudonitzschiae]MBM1832860.1 glycosyltransferase family 25 protein [Pseudosulfitobacter pseudonitzschiae]MBM1837728.1 glycosyltransferase family 25 protein [Pseudosulfitobacter pseudonitzschiae]MBM1842574.1 glycosyltransferase family 25 protein [Pseudosulfitobacter pseudonitzschiae]MBM1847442.1 glycosyltransferase family 25 protein [Pseudosulfi
MQSLIIHMSSSVARRPNATRLLSDLPDAQLVEAVNGRDPDQIKNVDIHAGNLLKPRYPFAMRPAEIGVFESHRKCWQHIVDAGWDFALIVEDDLQVEPQRLDRALRLITAHATPDMYVRLPVKQREQAARVVAEDDDIAFILPRVIGLQCICQVVGRGAAETLLNQSRQLDRPVDTWLQMHWATGQPVHTVLNAGNAEIANQIGGSTIQKKTRTSGKLMREIKRWRYRRAVAARPQT